MICAYSSCPVRESRKVEALPTMIIAFLALDSKTFSRSGLDMKPMSQDGLLLVIEMITMSLS